MTRIPKSYTFTNEEINTIMHLLRAEMQTYENKCDCDFERLNKTERERFDMLRNMYLNF